MLKVLKVIFWIFFSMVEIGSCFFLIKEIKKERELDKRPKQEEYSIVKSVNDFEYLTDFQIERTV